MDTRSIQCAVVVGAGIAGLAAASRLHGRGVAVTVLDKARGVGGRMATRRIGDAVADHGAQYFTARDPRFVNLVRGWSDSGLVNSWDAPPHREVFVGARGMTAVPKSLAAGIDVRLRERVLSVENRGSHWRVRTESGTILRADAVILTAPVPQSLAMLEGGGSLLPGEVRQTLEAIEYDPCFVAMAVLDGPSGLPGSGWLALDGDPIAVLADNRRKGISPGRTVVTVQAGPAFSREHLGRDKGEVGRVLLAQAAPRLGSRVRDASFQRWLYSRPLGRRDTPCLAVRGEPPLVFAGDAFGGPRVEGAWLSGLAAAETLIEPGARSGSVSKGIER